MSKTLALFASLAVSACMVSSRPPANGPGPGPSGPPPHHEHDHDHDGGAAQPPARERIIEGRVIDAATKQPIDGAAIDIASPATQGGTITVNTDASGHYRSAELPPDELHIRCRREHYAPESHVMRLQPGVTRIDCALNRER